MVVRMRKINKMRRSKITETWRRRKRNVVSENELIICTICAPRISDPEKFVGQ